MLLTTPITRPRQINCRMAPDTWRRLQAEAVRRRKSITELAREILERQAARLPTPPALNAEADTPEI